MSELGTNSEAAAEAEAPASSSPKSDANDYSRFDEISDSESDGGDSDDEPSVAEKIKSAGDAKMQGNDAFKKKENAEAAKLYRKGVKSLEDVSKSHPKPTATQTVEVQELLLSLNLNLAMAEIKLERWSGATKAATAALALDGNNVKALFRRAVASSRMGDFSEAKQDLTALLKIDPDNREGKVELAKLKKRIQEIKARDKKSFSGLFDRMPSDDRENQRQEKLEQQAKEREAKRKRWEEESERRKEAGEEEITFEAWCEELEAEEKARKEEEEKEKKEEEEKERAARRAAKRQARQATAAEDAAADVDEDDEKIIEEAKKMNMRGYKTTADGRKTSYFHNEMDAKTKELIGDITPTRITPTKHGNTSTAGAPAATSNEGPKRLDPGAGGGGVSSWNAGGTTWEERDCTDWAKERLKAHFKSGKASSGIDDFKTNPGAVVEAVQSLDMGAFTRGEENQEASLDKLASLAANLAMVSARVKAVKKVEGDANVAVVRGSKRYLFDLSATVEYEVTVDESFGMDDDTEGPERNVVHSKKARETKYEGTLTLTELSSLSSGDGSDVEIARKPKTSVAPKHQARVKEILGSLEKDLTSRCLPSFITDFQKSF